jgi:hypothetical protein
MAAGPSGLRLLLPRLGLASPTLRPSTRRAGREPSGLASPEESRGSHAYASALTATSARRSPWAEPTWTSGWGRISYHVGVDLRPGKLAGLVWAVDAPLDFHSIAQMPEAPLEPSQQRSFWA